jgi:hypothetical protein
MSPAARFHVAPDVSWRDAPGELLLFDARTDRYCVLDAAAAEVWRRLATGGTLDEVAADLARQFDAPVGTILADVTEAADDFLSRGLIVAAAGD